MSIRPILLNGMVQRTQDVGSVKQGEDNKAVMQQQNIGIQQQRKEDKLTHQVQQTEEKENEGYRFDAKEKGNGTYEGNKKKKKKEMQQDGKVVLKGQSRGFDIKI